MKKEYFLGGNTIKGFYSYYDYLADREKVNKIYIIKGGPGTGKSTTMKMIAKWGEEAGYSVDYIHCSSDPDSLDGVVINEIGIAMVDGTSPHVVDAKHAGAVETIVNMGEFWDEKALRTAKSNIITCNKKISEKFNEAYNYLEAAGSLNKNCICKIDKKKVSQTAENILKDIPAKSEENSGCLRKLFADGITPEGIVSYADGICDGKRIVLKSDIFGCSKYITEKVAEGLIKLGYDTELYFSPLDPENEIRHIVLPKENISILTSDFISFINENNAFVIDADGFAENSDTGTDFIRNKILVFTMIQQAVKSISQAKKLHDKLEGFYVPNIDFSLMEKKRKAILDEIKSFSQE